MSTYSCQIIPYTLNFKQPGGTSRGILTTKETWFLLLWKTDNPEIKGIGECSMIRGLNPDDTPEYERKLQEVAAQIDYFIADINELERWPSIRFGLETALHDLQNGGKQILYPTDFTLGEKGIPINGLVWMGPYDFMEQQVKEKIAQGFRCIKIKIGAIDFEEELRLLKKIRNEFTEEDIEIRVDANGAFSYKEALVKLDILASLHLHSIEQPIKPGNHEQMAELCQKNLLPIALDEELIGIYGTQEKKQLLHAIKPQYIILKPSLVGGIAACNEWIQLAEEQHISWWATSALESNIGLNAIAQWIYTFPLSLPQGLGTGQLYTNNIPSPLEIRHAHLWYNPAYEWDLDVVNSE